MIATVNVRLYYQPHCPDCMKQVEETVSSAIRDQSVAGLSMVAQNKCEHDALAAPRLTSSTKPASVGKASPPAMPPAPGSMEVLPGLSLTTNGFDVHGVN
jgi:hypothetical protein